MQEVSVVMTLICDNETFTLFFISMHVFNSLLYLTPQTEVNPNQSIPTSTLHRFEQSPKDKNTPLH